MVADESFTPFSSAGVPAGGTLDKLTDKYGMTTPNPIHLFLNGLVANDLSYITNEVVNIINSGVDEANILFKFDNIPTALISSLKFKFRWLSKKDSVSDLYISVWQGRPRDVFHNVFWVEGVETLPTEFTRLAAFQETADVAINTWFDTEVTISPAAITDSDDIWVIIETTSSRGIGSPSVRQVSFMVLEVTGSFSTVDTPTFKNYVNDLTRILNLSVVQKGTKGTSTYCYVVVPCDSSGVCGPPSDEVSITDGNATLDATDHICISWLDTGATNYRVYRTCSPSGLGLGLLATVLPNLGDCGTGGGGGGDTGYKDDGTKCITDCDDVFNPDDFEGCEGKTTVTIGAKETPTVVSY